MLTEKTKTPLFNITRLSERKINTTTLGLFWGKAGSGKTAVCGTAGDRTLYLNIGQGDTTLKSKWWREKYPDRNPMIVDVYEKLSESGIVSEPQAFDMVGDLIEYGVRKIRDQIDNIVLDDITYLTRFGMYKAYLFNKLKNKTSTLSTAESTNSKIDIAIPELGDYGTLSDLLNWFMAAHTDLCRAEGVNLFVAAHEKTLWNPPIRMGGEKTIKGYMPAFPGSTYNDSIPGLFDLVWHFETIGGGNNIKYKARTVGDDNMNCKTRWGGLFKEMEEDVDLLKVMQRIKESVK